MNLLLKVLRLHQIQDQAGESQVQVVAEVVLLFLIQAEVVRQIQEVAEVADQQAEEVVAVDLLEHM
jgi:hypothetical protein